MKQLLTKTSQGGVKSYVTPQTELIEVKIERNFLESFNVGGNKGDGSIDDLGDTDMGTIIWS